jgi:hypothetical protein
MVAEDRASAKVETSFWPHTRGFDFQTTTDGQIERDFLLSGQASPSVISEARPMSRQIPSGPWARGR